MKREPPLPQELWGRIPPEIQAAIWVLVDGYERRMATLETEVAELKERLNQTAQHSARPPSADPPTVKRTPPRAPAGRQRGAQPGQPRYERTLVRLEQGQEVVPCKPHQCRRGGAALPGSESQPLRHQGSEVPLPRREVIE